MPFTTVFALSPTFIIEANHDNRDVIVNLYSLSNTGAVIRCWDFDNATNDGQLTYVALGKQQWGLYDFPGSNGDKIYFPVAFTVMCAAAIVQPTGHNAHGVTNRTTTYIQGDFRYGDSQKVGTWIAVGY